MKHRRKIAFVLLLAMVAVVFAACQPGRPHTELTIDPVTGAGTRTFYVDVDKNDVPDVDNNFGPEGNIPDVDAFVEMFRNNTPDYCDIKAVDHPNPTDDGKDIGYYTFELTFSFANLDEYNARLKEIITDEIWATADVADTTITTVTEADGSITYTLHEDARSISLFGVWFSTLAFNDTTGAFVKVWDLPTEPGEMVDEASSTFTVNFGGTTEIVNLAEADDFEVSVTLAAPAVTEPEPGTDTNTDTTAPKTGDSSIIYIAAALLLTAAAGSVIVLRRHKNHA